MIWFAKVVGEKVLCTKPDFFDPEYLGVTYREETISLYPCETGLHAVNDRLHKVPRTRTRRSHGIVDIVLRAQAKAVYFGG